MLCGPNQWNQGNSKEMFSELDEKMKTACISDSWLAELIAKT